jgi:DNA-binding NarL/FixJ family response regulator
VLVVDDDDVHRRTTARILNHCGYACSEAASSAAARLVLDADPEIAVVLCDISMPGESGIELLQDLSVDHPDVAVVMTTATDDPKMAATAFELGAFGYVIKPFEINELLISVASALRRREINMAQRERVQALQARIDAATPTPTEVGQQRIRVLVVDDHQIFAESLVRLLERSQRLEVVGTAGTVATAVALAVRCNPDVVLMDFTLPDGDGDTAAAQIKTLMPAVGVIMLTACTGDAALVRAIAAGCSGFVRKDDAVDTLLAAIVAAHEGEMIDHPADLASLLRQLKPTDRGLGGDITPREREILELTASGLINKQIARHLGLRLNTVRNHSQSILQKLQAHSRLEAVATAVREGIISYPR